MSYLCVGMIIDFILGDPLTWPHPVIYIGKLINRLEQVLYKSKYKKIFGFILVLTMIITIYIIIEILYYIVSFNCLIKNIFIIYALYSAIAYRSLIKASDEVFRELKNDSIHKARLKLSYIVGRDTEELNEEEIVKGTIETVAENTIDGIIAPIFYALIGLVIFNKPVHFIWIYKGINTMDSMIGYMSEKYIHFGYGAAKLDDIVNYVPARIGSIIMIISGSILGLSTKNSIKIYIRDRYNHKSPNSAHSESVVAGLLNIKLGGDNKYFGKLVKKPAIGDDIRLAELEDIKKTQLIVTVTYMIIFILIILWVIINEV